MLETLITLLGGGLGGLLRLAPEVMKLMDRKNERSHELAMFDKQLEADRLKGEQRLAETQAAGQITLDQAGLVALTESIKAQGQLTGVKWVDALSQLMRPLITLQWVVLLYPAVIVASFITLLHGGGDVLSSLQKVFGTEEKALVSVIIGFWFVNRSMTRGR